MAPHQQVVDALLAPARAIQDLQETLARATEEAEALRQARAADAVKLSQLQAEVGRLTAELARSAPVPSYDEMWLAKRGATLTYRVPHDGRRAGKPEVTLTGSRINPVQGGSTIEVLDQVRKREPVKRRGSK